MTLVEARPFTTRFTVRTYECDQNGHLNGAAYVQWADQTRWECSRAAGVSTDDLTSMGLGPVNLVTTIRYVRELRPGDEVDVSCTFVWTENKTVSVVQQFRRPDGELCAELVSVGGLLDLDERRLVPAPRDRWRGLAKVPELLGL